MKNEEALEYLRGGSAAEGNSEIHRCMHDMAEEAMRLTARLNGSYHEPEKVREIFSEITGKPVDNSFRLFPPFYTECGKNIYVGKGVFINCCCHFQDHGGVYIGDNVLIGSHVVFATINHGLSPEKRHDNIPSPIHVGNNVWIGSSAVILPGVAIGDNSVIAAGAVVTRDVPSNTVAGGVPARILKRL